MKPDISHGERFLVEVGDVSWKTTSSRNLSLKYKLEEAKKYLRNLKQKRPDLFEEYSMNGDLNKYGLEQLTSFFEISQNAGYTNLKKINLSDNTDVYLKENTKGLSDYEIDLLHNL